MKKQRGFVLPVSLCVAGVVLFLGASTAQMSAGDLQVSNHLYYKERARQVADFALETAQAQNADTNGNYSFDGITGCNGHDIGRVEVFDNRTGTLGSASGCPVQVPVGYQYWIATGEARNDAGHVLGTVRIGALVRFGLPIGAAGAQVRFLSSDSGAESVAFSAVDQDNMPLNDRILCATEARTGELPFPNPSDLIKPVTLRHVDSFSGKVRIPQGTSEDDLVQVFAPTTLTVDSAGGLFNVPNYSPPLTNNAFSSFTAPGGVSDLPPGTYEELVLPRNANLNLHGSYHFKTLRLDSAGSGTGILGVGSEGAANVYVDRIVSPPLLELGLRNAQTRSGAFRLNLKPADSTSSPLTVQLAVQASGEGGVSLVAPKHRVRVVAQGNRLLRGSFNCEALTLSFSAPSNLAGQPAFVYDASLDTTRRSDGQYNLRTTLPNPPSTAYEAVDQPMIMNKTDL
jgi:hypothetical protein